MTDALAGRAEPAQYLTFALGGATYAIGILAVKEIIEYGGVTTVPMMPACICGVINLRGAVVPVVDLALRFGWPAAAPGKRASIVIVELDAGGARQLVGALVDAVDAVLTIAAAEIGPPPAFGTRLRGDFLLGMARVDGRFVVLLKAEQALDVDGAGAPAQDAPAPA